METDSSRASTQSDERDSAELDEPQTSGSSDAVETTDTSEAVKGSSSSSSFVDESRAGSPSGESCTSIPSSISLSALPSTADKGGTIVKQHIEKENGTILREITDKALNIMNRKRKRTGEHKISKFISLAEGVHDFHIPQRFCSRPKGGADQHPILIDKVPRRLVTISQSPQLLTETLTIHVDYPSAEERERKEIEEIQSYKLDIHPVDPKIFEPPGIGKREPRHLVVIKPFNLTEFKRKEIQQKSSPFRFKAKPVPNGILEHPIGVPKKKKLPDVGKTLVQPFSFENRIEKMIKHKKEKIKKDDEKRPVFKAQPASVVHKQPFIPKKPERYFEPHSVLLHTEQRAQRRKEFDEQVKQHIKDVEVELQRKKELEEKKIQEEIMHLRQQATHKAQPIRSYKPIPRPEKSYSTIPKSPSFSTRYKKQ